MQVKVQVHSLPYWQFSPGNATPYICMPHYLVLTLPSFFSFFADENAPPTTAGTNTDTYSVPKHPIYNIYYTSWVPSSHALGLSRCLPAWSLQPFSCFGTPKVSWMDFSAAEILFIWPHKNFLDPRLNFSLPSPPPFAQAPPRPRPSTSHKVAPMAFVAVRVSAVIDLHRL